MMSLIDPTMLFRFSVPCLKVSKPWGATGVSLTPRYALPSFQELSGREEYADVRIGWNNKGIFVQAEVTGKEQALWCGILESKTVMACICLLTRVILTRSIVPIVSAIGLLSCRKEQVLGEPIL